MAPIHGFRVVRQEGRPRPWEITAERKVVKKKSSSRADFIDFRSWRWIKHKQVERLYQAAEGGIMKNGKWIILIRLAVGAVFLSEGIQKFLFPETCGVGRFTQIGIPGPCVMAPFVGGVEILFGASILAGFLTRWAAVPLIIDISVAIASTKVPILLKQGFWAAAHEARTDYAMFLGLLFLLLAGGGEFSLDSIRKMGKTGKKTQS
jgi:uncharacterized membrane protein YphA (DoxX/SURF4 family)